MERDSFEKLLQNAVSKTDEELDQSTGKERVWNAIDRKQKVKGWVWYAAAAVVVLCSTIGIFGIPEEKQTANNTVEVLKPSKERVPIAAGKAERSRVEAQYQQRSVLKPRFPSQVPIDTSASAVADVKEIARPEPQIEVVKVTVIEPSATILLKEESKLTEPAFTVQFKRGKPAVKTTEENGVFAAFKRFKLKRDTAYFANAEEKHPSKIKLSFKKEN